MSTQRVAKFESLVQQVVAEQIRDQLGPDSAQITVTRVDAAPDLRNAIVWIGLLTTGIRSERLWESLERSRGPIQSKLAARLTTKFVPHLHLRADTGGAYAAEIDRLLKGL
jgi:ribosome-binding factor A